MTNMLVIPDAHAHPDYGNDRFDWLGKYIVETKPEIILCLGDFADMASLSSYDKGTRSFEGRRYRRDVEASVDALNRLFAPVVAYNQQRSRNKKQQYLPRTVMTVGNHEARIDKVTQHHPELHDTLSVDDLQFNRYFDEIVDFKQMTVIEGVAVSHYFVSGLMGRPIGGERAGHALLTKQGMSCVCGHSHLLDFAVRTRADGKKMMALVGGWYGHPDMVEDWNKNTAGLWWSGVTMLHNLKDGWAEDVSFISQSTLQRAYGE
jgi:hypothetical protein